MARQVAPGWNLAYLENLKKIDRRRVGPSRDHSFRVFSIYVYHSKCILPAKPKE